MDYKFNMQNTINEPVIIKWYDWNDGSHLIAKKSYNISSDGHVQVDALQNVTVQISVFQEDGSPLLDGIWRNFYASKRNMKIVQENGVTSIEYAD